MNANQRAVQNLTLLHEHHPDAAKGLLAFLKMQREHRMPPRFQLTQQDGITRLVDCRGEQPALLETSAQTTQLNDSTLLLVYSCGTGELVRHLARRIDSGKTILIEPEWDLLFLALQQQDWSGVLVSPNLLMLCGDDATEQVQGLLKRHRSLLKPSWDMIAGRGLNASDAKTLDKLSQFVEELSSQTVGEVNHGSRADVVIVTGDAHKELLPVLHAEASLTGIKVEPRWRSKAVQRFYHNGEAWKEIISGHMPERVLAFSKGVFEVDEWQRLAEQGAKRLVWFYDDPFRNRIDDDYFQCIDALYCFDPVLTEKLQAVSPLPVTYMPAGTTFSEGLPDGAQPNFGEVAISFVGSTGLPRIGERNLGLVTHPQGPFAKLRAFAESYVKQGSQVDYDRLMQLEITLPSQQPDQRVCFLEDLTTLAVRLIYLEALGERPLKIYGDDGWSNPQCVGGVSRYFQGHNLDYLTETPFMYHQSNININLFNVQCVDSPTVRVLDVMACGGFLLTEYRPFMERMFRIGEELEVFRTPEELGEKVDYYLNHRDEREAIARAGQKRVQKEHSYRQRFERMFSQ